MSETQTSSCNNACGDAVEVRNSTQVNLENTEISQQNNLKNPSQSGTSEIAQVAGGDNELKKVTIFILLSKFLIDTKEEN